MKRGKEMYGLISDDHFAMLAAEVVRVLGNGSNNNADIFVSEIAYAETNMGTTLDRSIYGQGAGVLQFDKIRLKDI